MRAGLRFCISAKLPGNVGAPGLRTKVCVAKDCGVLFEENLSVKGRAKVGS